MSLSEQRQAKERLLQSGGSPGQRAAFIGGQGKDCLSPPSRGDRGGEERGRISGKDLVLSKVKTTPEHLVFKEEDTSWN